MVGRAFVYLLQCCPVPALQSHKRIMSSLSRLLLCDGGTEGGVAFGIRVRPPGVVTWRRGCTPRYSKGCAWPHSQNPPSLICDWYCLVPTLRESKAYRGCIHFLLLLFKITDTYSLAVWRPEVQNQGVCRVSLPLKAPGEMPSLPLPACGSFLQALVFLGL